MNTFTTVILEWIYSVGSIWKKSIGLPKMGLDCGIKNSTTMGNPHKERENTKWFSLTR